MMVRICPTCDAGDPTSVIPFDECECAPAKPCEAPADGSPGYRCDEPAQANKRYCPRHLVQIQKLADAGRLP